MIPYPTIDPVAVKLGPLAARWYGIAYVLGFLSAYGILRKLASKGLLPLSADSVGELLSYLVTGVVFGGRVGYVVFYNLPYYASHPLKVFALWDGGMSFHGGLVGAGIAAWVFCRAASIPLLRVGDALALAAPPGLFFGRIANFINGELYGRVSAVPWAMVFPNGGPLPRHPSELYEAVLEGPVVWLVVGWAMKARRNQHGAGLGAFLVSYGLFRFLVEFTREPDAQLGFILGPFTMGQVLSSMLVIAGVAVLSRPASTSSQKPERNT